MSFMKRRSSLADEQPLSEINVTPFVDVVLVLLIIFMITAAVVEFGMQVGVPATTAATTARPAKPNVVQIASDARLFYDGQPINVYSIADQAKSSNPERPGMEISSIKRSGSSSGIIARAWRPEPASPATSHPGMASSMRFILDLAGGSSSIIRMRIIWQCQYSEKLILILAGDQARSILKRQFEPVSNISQCHSMSASHRTGNVGFTRL